ncbi:MAG TPA: hypothetical protein VMD58_05305 [Acidobacteriaceae bacterium]|nr:hypothetical protein [Acidobacteriaceae bacterium]
MTIAAGFSCEDGVLLCADTKVSTDVKTNESKLAFYRSEDAQLAMAFAMTAVDLDFSRSSADRCWAYAERCFSPSSTIESIRQCAEFSLAEFYRDEIFPHPDRPSNQPFFQFLIAVWLRGKTALFVSKETVLSSPQGTWECLGTGGYLGRNIIRQYTAANGNPDTLNEAALVASCAVESAIEYDESCGGEAEMILLCNDGRVESIADSVIFPGYSFLKTAGRGDWKLMKALASPSLSNGDLDFALAEHFERMRHEAISSKQMLDEIREARSKAALGRFPEGLPE